MGSAAWLTCAPSHAGCIPLLEDRVSPQVSSPIGGRQPSAHPLGGLNQSQPWSWLGALGTRSRKPALEVATGSGTTAFPGTVPRGWCVVRGGVRWPPSCHLASPSAALGRPVGPARAPVTRRRRRRRRPRSGPAVTVWPRDTHVHTEAWTARLRGPPRPRPRPLCRSALGGSLSPARAPASPGGAERSHLGPGASPGDLGPRPPRPPGARSQGHSGIWGGSGPAGPPATSQRPPSAADGS